MTDVQQSGGGSMTTHRSDRWAGIVCGLAGVVAVGLAATSMAAEAKPALHAPEGTLITAANLLLVPVAAYLAVWLWPVNRVVAGTGGACGIASLLLWAAAPSFLLWPLEALWIGLSAAWWLACGWLLLRMHRRFAIFTTVLAVAAALDAIVTALPGLPFLAAAIPGAWKLPLSLVWIFWLAALLLRRRVGEARLAP